MSTHSCRALVFVAIVCALSATRVRGADEAQKARHARMRTAVAEVLAQPEFADLRADPLAFQRQLRKWISAVLEKIFSPLQRLPRWAFWVLFGWMVLTLLAILAHLLYTLWMAVGSRAASRTAGGDSTSGRFGQLWGVPEMDFDAVYGEARRRLAAGDWPAAIKHLYVAAILGLDHRGVIAFRSSKTNGDYLRELRTQTQLQDAFRRLTGCFEPVVYGGRTATESTCRYMADAIEGLLDEPAAVAS